MGFQATVVTSLPDNDSGVLCAVFHRIGHLGRNSFDVVSCGCAVGVPRNLLNHILRNTQCIQVAPESAPCRVPAMPPRKRLIQSEIGVRFLVVSLSVLQFFVRRHGL